MYGGCHAVVGIDGNGVLVPVQVGVGAEVNGIFRRRHLSCNGHSQLGSVEGTGLTIQLVVEYPDGLLVLGQGLVVCPSVGKELAATDYLYAPAAGAEEGQQRLWQTTGLVAHRNGFVVAHEVVNLQNQ